MGRVRRPRTQAHKNPGIVWTEAECRAYVRVRGTLYTKRFDPSIVSITDMKDWRAAKRVEVLAALQRTQPASGSFGKDVETYLKAVQAMPTYAEREYHLNAWLDALGRTRARASITSDEIRAALQQWRLTGKDGAPLSESACNHRRTALMHLYTVLDGKAAANPVKDVPRFREPDPEPRGVSYAVLRKILKAMPESKTKARVRVLMWTGLPPASLKQIRPEDVRWSDSCVYVPRRRKGKGTKGRMLPLLPDALKAFKALARWDAFGPFSVDALRHSLHRACEAAGVEPIRAYDLRHSFGSAAYQASGDIRAVQALLDHSDVKLTERYTLSAVAARVESALESMRKVTAPVPRKKKQAKKRRAR